MDRGYCVDNIKKQTGWLWPGAEIKLSLLYDLHAHTKCDFSRKFRNLFQHKLSNKNWLKRRCNFHSKHILLKWFLNSGALGALCSRGSGSLKRFIDAPKIADSALIQFNWISWTTETKTNQNGVTQTSVKCHGIAYYIANLVSQLNYDVQNTRVAFKQYKLKFSWTQYNQIHAWTELKCATIISIVLLNATETKRDRD